MERKTIKDKVEYVLQRYAHTRNSDAALVQMYWQTWHSDKIHYNENGVPWIKLEDILHIQNSDGITRCRRKFQEPCEEHPNGKYPPTDPEVLRMRRDKQRKVRDTINTQDWDAGLRYPYNND